jgi:two-component system sensor histidine kinase BaeS
MNRRYWLRLAGTFGCIVLLTEAAGFVTTHPLLLVCVGLLSMAGTTTASVLHARRVVRLVNDVTTFADRVAAGEYTARVHGDGQDELAHLADSVNAMAARLALEGQARAGFIGKVSHELRTPLTVIKGYVYTLRRSETDPAIAARLEVIDSECERLAYLVEDLLELSRAQSGELRVSAETFPLRECVEEVAERFRLEAERHEVAIELRWSGNGALVMGDENRLRQVFGNLLTNGIKYAPPGTAVVVEGDSTGDELRVSVEDSGRGIAADALPHIFEEFYQAPERSEPGAGLGLAVARELTEAHGGRLDVSTAVGRGTRFTVSLPAWREVA